MYLLKCTVFTVHFTFTLNPAHGNIAGAKSVQVPVHCKEYSQACQEDNLVSKLERNKWSYIRHGSCKQVDGIAEK